MVRRSFTRRMDGFTLLEIMVALVVFATLATAVLSASQYVIKQAGAVEERLIAAWVADNHLNELRLQSALLIGQSQQVVQMNHRHWLVRQSIRTANAPQLLAVDVDVSLDGRDQPVHRASGWIPHHGE